jgi:protein-L-isoaspartate(D-aspartate) O-methyltransferase
VIAMFGAVAQDYPAERERLLAEIDATYAETRASTGMAAMSPAVRAAIARVERHRFVPDSQRAAAYRNHPLPIGDGQTISQPYIVALSTDLVAPKAGDVVLEVGTGSGYQAAVLAEIVSRVYTIERLASLGRKGAETLSRLGYRNVETRIGDGYAGWSERGPFDAIVVTAAAPEIPPALIAQLKPGGRMVIPLGEDGGIQHLVLVEKGVDGKVGERRVLPVRFVPLVPGSARSQ